MLRRSRSVGALLAALVFLVQGLGAAHALGAGERRIVLDAFGNPLCMDSRGHAPGEGNRYGSLTDCCALACAGIASPLAAPPDAGIVVVPNARLLASLTGPMSAATHHPATDRTAGNPRAPPPLIGTIGRLGRQSCRTAA